MISRILLHNHSTWSDGRMSLDRIVRLGARLGAAAVVMSEHDFYFTPQKWEEYVNACQLASTERCTIIPGIEYSSPSDKIHVITMGSPYFYGARGDLVETLAAVRAAGGASVLAHPSRKGCFEMLSGEVINLLDAVEIWNRKVDGLLPVKAYFEFARSLNLATTVGMDLHSWRQIFPMWNEIDVHDGIDGKSVALALRARAIKPAACLIGKLENSLNAKSSLALTSLAAAEKCRCMLRNLRDGIQAP
jgi:hypothetical protein